MASCGLIGVLGATGNVGKQVVSRLVKKTNLDSVVALSRQTQPPASLIALGLEHRYVDYNRRSSLVDAFRGLDTLIFPGSDGPLDQMLLHHRNVLVAASESGVRRMVYLSALDVDSASVFPYAIAHRETEESLAASGLEVTILRASIFSEFFIDAFLEPAASTGRLRLPTKTGRVSFVSREDVAACLAAAALEQSEARLTPYYITGPIAISLEEAARQYRAIRGIHLQYEAVSEETYRAELVDQEGWLIEAFATMLSSSIPAERFAHVSSDVELLTGRPPQDFGSCAAAKGRSA